MMHTCSCMDAQQHEAGSEQLHPPGNDTLPSPSPPQQVVSLCVGGRCYQTTIGTLTAVPGSYLAILFDSDNPWQPSSVLPGSQMPFIDRDGELFRFVLAYLRAVRDTHQPALVMLPDTPAQLQQLKAEADFYGLPGGWVWQW